MNVRATTLQLGHWRLLYNSSRKHSASKLNSAMAAEPEDSIPFAIRPPVGRDPETLTSIYGLHDHLCRSFY